MLLAERTDTVALVLTDSSILCGFLLESSKDIPRSRSRHLALGHSDCHVLVPRAEVAGISPVAYSQSTRDEDLHRPLTWPESYESASSEILDELLKSARRRGYTVRDSREFDFIIGSRRVLWGDIQFSADTPLYCDWGYLSRKGGGLNSVGVGLMAVSFSAGWTKSLWSAFGEIIKETATVYEKVCSRSEVALRAFPVFLRESQRRSDSEQPKTHALTMEGGEWSPVFLARSRVARPQELRDVDWVAYFRNDSFMFPRALWGKLRQPIRVYGEVVTASARTTYGNRECFLKVRAAACLLKDDNHADN